MPIPNLERRHISRGILYGAILLVWLSTENAEPWLTSLLGAGLAALVVSLGLVRWFGGKKLPPIGFVLVGALIGFSAVWATQFLMIFKNAWHAHAFLDFPTAIIVGMSRRLIPWTLAGGLIGMAVWLWRISP